MPPGRRRSSAGVEQLALEGRELLDLLGRLAPAGVGPRLERAEVGARRVEQDPVERAGRAPRGRRRCTTSTHGARMRAHVVAQRVGAAAGASSIATISPSPPISAARWVVFAPGAAHMSSTRSPGCGSSTRATSIDPRDCGMTAPSANGVDPCASHGPSSTSPSGTPGARVRTATPIAAASSSRVVTSCWPAARSRAARCRAPSARGRRRARAGPTTAARSSPGASGRARRPRACASSIARRSPPRPSRVDPAHHRVGEPVRARAHGLDQLDGLLDRGVVGHAVHVEELEGADAQRVAAAPGRSRSSGRDDAAPSTWSSVRIRCTVP